MTLKADTHPITVAELILISEVTLEERTDLVIILDRLDVLSLGAVFVELFDVHMAVHFTKNMLRLVGNSILRWKIVWVFLYLVLDALKGLLADTIRVFCKVDLH